MRGKGKGRKRIKERKITKPKSQKKKRRETAEEIERNKKSNECIELK